MTDTAIRDLDVLTPAWRELETRTPVRLRAIENERHYRAMVKFMNTLLDKVGDRETHPLMGLLDIVTAFVHDYEESHIEIPDADPSIVLRFLMEQHDLRQTDLAEDFRTAGMRRRKKVKMVERTLQRSFTTQQCCPVFSPHSVAKGIGPLQRD